MTENKQPYGYQLAEMAALMAKKESLANARAFLTREMRNKGLMFWESIAVVNTFNELRK